jgi:cytidylate kinase
MAVITISRQFGSGGKTLGKMLADKLGYTFADDNIIQMVAKEANVSPKWVRSFEKEAGTKLSKIISKMVSQRLLDRVLKDERGYIDEQLYLDYLVLIIAQIADEGNVIIMGRGSQYILNDHPDAHHILLIDNVEHRKKFLMGKYDISATRAAQVVTNEDKRRFNLYSKLGKKDFDDPFLYDLVINMSRTSMQTAEKLVCDLIE